jgi:hypothetical protein
MPEDSLAEVIRTYLKAYETKDRSALESTMSDDFTFTSPYDDHIDRATYLKRCWPNSARTRAIHIQNYSKWEMKPSFSTTWSPIAENLSATANFLLGMGTRSSLSKSISDRRSAESKT